MVATHRLTLPAGHLVRSYLSSSADAAAGTEALLSLWAQWYIGLLVPPLMLALLNEPQASAWRQNISMSNFMKAAGRPASGLMCIAMPTSRAFTAGANGCPGDAHPAAGC
jgi:hypothetical protein